MAAHRLPGSNIPSITLSDAASSCAFHLFEHCTPTIEFPRAGNRVYNHMPCGYTNICIFAPVIHSCDIFDLVVHSVFSEAVGVGFWQLLQGSRIKLWVSHIPDRVVCELCSLVYILPFYSTQQRRI